MLVGDIIPRNAALRGDALAYVHERGRTTFAGHAARCYRLAHALIRLGVGRQDRVSLLAQNAIEGLEVLGAGQVTGIVVHPINVRLTAPEIAYVLGDAEPRVVVFEAQYEAEIDAVRAALAIRPVFVRIGDGRAPCPDWASDYETLLAASRAERPQLRPAPDDTACLFYSSGSTGRPKGVMLGQRAQYFTALTVMAEVGIVPGDRGSLVIPMFHIGGEFSQLAHMLAGAPMHIFRRFDPAALVAAVERDRLTTLHLAPTMIRSLLDLPDIDRRDLSSVRTLSYGASAMPVALLRRALARFGPILIQRYGSTESAVVSYLDKHQHVVDGPAPVVARLASAGQPSFMSEVRAVDADGRPCPPGVAGLLQVRNPDLVMQGYWRNAAATAAVMKDGWYELGDVGHLDGDGYVFIVDRKTEMIISGGENIYPREVEEAILHHPAVADAAVIGVPDDHWGESVLAFVVLSERDAASEADIIAYCQGRIASYKKPRRVEFRAALPRASTGKIDKLALRTPFWQGRTRQI